MSGHKNFKQLNDVSYLRFNFTYMPQSRPQKPRLVAETGTGTGTGTETGTGTVDCRGARGVRRREKECRRSRQGCKGFERSRRMERESRAYTRLSACTCHMHFHCFVCVCWEHFVHSLSCCLAALPVTNNNNNKFELDLAENRIENCFNFRKMAHNSRRAPCEIYEAQTQYSSVLAGSGCCTQRERARESEWGTTWICMSYSGKSLQEMPATSWMQQSTCSSFLLPGGCQLPVATAGAWCH